MICYQEVGAREGGRERGWRKGRKEGWVRAPSGGQSVQGHQDRLGASKYCEYLKVPIHSLLGGGAGLVFPSQCMSGSEFSGASSEGKLVSPTSGISAL